MNKLTILSPLLYCCYATKVHALSDLLVETLVVCCRCSAFASQKELIEFVSGRRAAATENSQYYLILYFSSICAMKYSAAFVLVIKELMNCRNIKSISPTTMMTMPTNTPTIIPVVPLSVAKRLNSTAIPPRQIGTSTNIIL